MEKVGQSVSPRTQARSQGGESLGFKEGEKVERDVNQERVRGIGLEAQDKKEEEREGDVLEKEKKGRGKGTVRRKQHLRE